MVYLLIVKKNLNGPKGRGKKEDWSEWGMSAIELGSWVGRGEDGRETGDTNGRKCAMLKDVVCCMIESQSLTAL